jgi:hypothetical protein
MSIREPRGDENSAHSECSVENEELPPELQAEVKDFTEFLLEKKLRKEGRPLSQDWAGALRGYRGQYTSLDFQKKALEWRSR